MMPKPCNDIRVMHGAVRPQEKSGRPMLVGKIKEHAGVSGPQWFKVTVFRSRRHKGGFTAMPRVADGRGWTQGGIS